MVDLARPIYTTSWHFCMSIPADLTNPTVGYRKATLSQFDQNSLVFPCSGVLLPACFWIVNYMLIQLRDLDLQTHNFQTSLGHPRDGQKEGQSFISSVQLLSRVQLSATPGTAAYQAFLSITNSQSLPKLMSIESVMPSNHLILCHPLLLPSIFLSIRVFSNESALHIRWPKYWSFSFNISPSSEHSGLTSFRMDWLDLLAVQGTLKSLLQSILQRSAFFIVQLSHLHMTTGKTIALTRQTFVGKVMPLLYYMLSMLVTTFLPRSKCLLISWLQSPSAVILEPPKIKSVTVSTVSPSICHEVMRPDAMTLVF